MDEFDRVIAVPSSQGASSQVSIQGSKTVTVAKPSPLTVDQQLKFLHLQAEAESFLQQLKLIKQQREQRQRGSSKEV